MENAALKVTIRLFAGLKDRAGASSVSLELGDGASVADAISAACEATPKRWTAPTAVMVAVNDEYVQREQMLAEGDELALIPPVSGGALDVGSSYVVITEDELDPQSIADHVRADTDGAVLVFEGVTRNHNDGRNVEYLEYEAYRPMADKKIAELIAEMRSDYEIDRVAVAHRTGRVGIGETSLVVAVSSAHRKAAFDSALYFVDRLKQVVPIWKKEFFEGGEVWINDTPPE